MNTKQKSLIIFGIGFMLLLAGLLADEIRTKKTIETDCYDSKDNIIKNQICLTEEETLEAGLSELASFAGITILFINLLMVPVDWNLL